MHRGSTYPKNSGIWVRFNVFFHTWNCTSSVAKKGPSGHYFHKLGSSDKIEYCKKNSQGQILEYFEIRNHQYQLFIFTSTLFLWIIAKQSTRENKVLCCMSEIYSRNTRQNYLVNLPYNTCLWHSLWKSINEPCSAKKVKVNAEIGLQACLILVQPDYYLFSFKVGHDSIPNLLPPCFTKAMQSIIKDRF